MSFRFVTPLLFTLTCAWLTAAPSADAPDRRREGLVRILSVFDTQPVHYKRTSNGESIPVFAAFDEEPPPSIYLKVGDAYNAKPLLRNAVSPPHTNFRGKTEGIQGYFVKIFGQADGLDDFARSMGAKPPPNQRKPKERSPKFAPMCKPAPADGKDYLLCVYQPDPSAKWFAPKSLLVDISHEKLPLGACLVINLGNRPVLAQVGAGTRATQLAPGAYSCVIPTAGNTGDNLSFKMAVIGKKGPEIIFDRISGISAESRTVFVAYTAFDQNEGKPVLAKLCPIKEPPKELVSLPKEPAGAHSAAP